MNHPNHEEWMAYLYKELGRKRQTELKEHLKLCPQCQADVTTWRSVMKELDRWKLPQQHRGASKPRWDIKWAARWTAAAVLLIFAGYAVGRVTIAPPPDVEQLHQALETSLKSTLEPAIRQNVAEQLGRDWRLALAGSYLRLKDELSDQFRRELNAYALHTLATSNAVTNELLTELIEAINTAQAQDRRWVAAALEQTELNRLRDKSQLINGLETLAAETDNELLRTKQDLAHLLVYTQPGDLVPYESENLNKLDERSEK
jgi:anti-sigma factor RsiW